MRKLIQVKRRDIDGGCRNHSATCPVALAILRQTEFTPQVGTKIVDLYKGNSLEGFSDLPIRAQRFIRNFDIKGYKAVRPFNFYLEL